MDTTNEPLMSSKISRLFSVRDLQVFHWTFSKYREFHHATPAKPEVTTQVTQKLVLIRDYVFAAWNSLVALIRYHLPFGEENISSGLELSAKEQDFLPAPLNVDNGDSLDGNGQSDQSTSNQIQTPTLNEKDDIENKKKANKNKSSDVVPRRDTVAPSSTLIPQVVKSAVDRRDFAAIRAIPDSNFKNILQFTIGPSTSFDRLEVLERLEGSFNHVVMIRSNYDSGPEDYVIKVPFVGTIDRWQEGDAHNLRCEAGLMRYIRARIPVPVPEVLSYDDCLHNSIGAPYICMKRLPGTPAYNMWFDSLDGPVSEGDSPSEATQKWRTTFLKSLAYLMDTLYYLDFDKIGMPNFDECGPDGNPDISERYVWTPFNRLKPEDINTRKVLFKRNPCSTAHEFFTKKLDENWPSELDPEDFDDDSQREICLGMRKFLDILFSCPAFTQSKENPKDIDAPDTFTLCHTDLDLQNILVDERGNITGVLDWDSCFAAPRSIGVGSLPLFLRKDWLPEFSVNNMPHMSWTLEYWRMMYAEALKEAGCTDARFTLHSGIYHAAYAAMYEGGNTWDLAHKIFGEIWELRKCKSEEILEELGQGSPKLEKFLEMRIAELLEPEALPWLSADSEEDTESEIEEEEEELEDEAEDSEQEEGDAQIEEETKCSFSDGDKDYDDTSISSGSDSNDIHKAAGRKLTEQELRTVKRFQNKSTMAFDYPFTVRLVHL